MSDYDFSSLRRNDQSDSKRLLIAMFVSVLFLIVWNVFFSPSEEELSKLKDNKQVEKTTDIDVQELAAKEQEQQDSIRQKKEIFLQNDIIHAGFDVANNRITFLALKKYKIHDGSAKKVVLLDDEHFVEAGWLGTKHTKIDWKLKNKTNNSVSVVGNYLGLQMETLYTLNDDYTISVSQKVVNNSGKKIDLASYNRLFFKDTADRVENSSAFRGILMLNKNSINEIDFSDLKKNNIDVMSTEKSWIGVSDQYWITALASKNYDNVNYSAKKSQKKTDFYQIDFYNKIAVLEKGATLEDSSIIVLAPKQLELLQQIEKKYNLVKFDKAIDFGMFYFLSKPLLIILKRLYSIFGNFGVAIILLTILVRMIIFPFANRSYRVMARMKKIAPQIEDIRQQCGNDKKAFQIATYQLYKENNINPMSAIVPLLLQIPVFFALYKVLVISIEMRDAPFISWIVDLSSKDPSSIFNIFGLLPYNVPSIMQIGLLPCLMGLTMFIQQKLNPQTGLDPSQKKIMDFLPIIFTIMFASMPAGLILYWICSNIFTIIQQAVLIKIVNR